MKHPLFPFDRAPVIICGAHGGGTSYITKLLRFCGFFAGADAGDLMARKYHEAEGFKNFSRKIAEHCGDVYLMTPGSLEKAEYEMEHNLESWVQMAKDELEKISLSYIDDYSPRWPIKEYLKHFFYSPFKSQLWAWPGYADYINHTYSAGQPWGWKDPRNSILLPVWQQLFEKPAILIIHKHKTGKESKSSSGEWFENIASSRQLEAYQYPPGLEHDQNSYNLHFDEAVNDFNIFNRLLKWMSLPGLSEKEFENLKTLTGFETKK